MVSTFLPSLSLFFPPSPPLFFLASGQRTFSDRPKSFLSSFTRSSVVSFLLSLFLSQGEKWLSQRSKGRKREKKIVLPFRMNPFFLLLPRCDSQWEGDQKKGLKFPSLHPLRLHTDALYEEFDFFFILSLFSDEKVAFVSVHLSSSSLMFHSLLPLSSSLHCQSQISDRLRVRVGQFWEACGPFSARRGFPFGPQLLVTAIKLQKLQDVVKISHF